MIYVAWNKSEASGKVCCCLWLCYNASWFFVCLYFCCLVGVIKCQRDEPIHHLCQVRILKRDKLYPCYIKSPFSEISCTKNKLHYIDFILVNYCVLIILDSMHGL